jgi:hypothetical protein
MEKIAFPYFIRDGLLAKGKQPSLSSFSLQLSKKSEVAPLRKG